MNSGGEIFKMGRTIKNDWELRTQIYIGLDVGYIKNEMASNWIQETKEISAMIVGLIKSKKSEL